MRNVQLQPATTAEGQPHTLVNCGNLSPPHSSAPFAEDDPPVDLPLVTSAIEYAFRCILHEKLYKQDGKHKARSTLYIYNYVADIIENYMPPNHSNANHRDRDATRNRRSLSSASSSKFASPARHTSTSGAVTGIRSNITSPALSTIGRSASSKGKTLKHSSSFVTSSSYTTDSPHYHTLNHSYSKSNIAAPIRYNINDAAHSIETTSLTDNTAASTAALSSSTATSLHTGRSQPSSSQLLRPKSGAVLLQHSSNKQDTLHTKQHNTYAHTQRPTSSSSIKTSVHPTTTPTIHNTEPTRRSKAHQLIPSAQFPNYNIEHSEFVSQLHSKRNKHNVERYLNKSQTNRSNLATELNVNVNADRVNDHDDEGSHSHLCTPTTPSSYAEAVSSPKSILMKRLQQQQLQASQQDDDAHLSTGNYQYEGTIPYGVVDTNNDVYHDNENQQHRNVMNGTQRDNIGYEVENQVNQERSPTTDAVYPQSNQPSSSTQHDTYTERVQGSITYASHTSSNDTSRQHTGSRMFTYDSGVTDDTKQQIRIENSDQQYNEARPLLHTNNTVSTSATPNAIHESSATTTLNPTSIHTTTATNNHNYHENTVNCPSTTIYTSVSPTNTGEPPKPKRNLAKQILSNATQIQQSLEQLEVQSVSREAHDDEQKGEKRKSNGMNDDEDASHTLVGVEGQGDVEHGGVDKGAQVNGMTGSTTRTVPPTKDANDMGSSRSNVLHEIKDGGKALKRSDTLLSSTSQVIKNSNDNHPKKKRINLAKQILANAFTIQESLDQLEREQQAQHEEESLRGDEQERREEVKEQQQMEQRDTGSANDRGHEVLVENHYNKKPSGDVDVVTLHTEAAAETPTNPQVASPSEDASIITSTTTAPRTPTPTHPHTGSSSKQENPLNANLSHGEKIVKPLDRLAMNHTDSQHENNHYDNDNPILFGDSDSVGSPAVGSNPPSSEYIASQTTVTSYRGVHDSTSEGVVSSTLSVATLSSTTTHTAIGRGARTGTTNTRRHSANCNTAGTTTTPFPSSSQQQHPPPTTTIDPPLSTVPLTDTYSSRVSLSDSLLSMSIADASTYFQNMSRQSKQRVMEEFSGTNYSNSYSSTHTAAHRRTDSNTSATTRSGVNSAISSRNNSTRSTGTGSRNISNTSATTVNPLHDNINANMNINGKQPTIKQPHPSTARPTANKPPPNALAHLKRQTFQGSHS